MSYWIKKKQLTFLTWMCSKSTDAWLLFHQTKRNRNSGIFISKVKVSMSSRSKHRPDNSITWKILHSAKSSLICSTKMWSKCSQPKTGIMLQISSPISALHSSEGNKILLLLNSFFRNTRALQIPISLTFSAMKLTSTSHFKNDLFCHI